MTTMNVLDSTGATVAVEKPLPPGQTTGSASRPVVIASDQSDLPIKPGSSEAKVTAATIGTGGVGYLGWLSTIANYLAGTLTVATHAVTQSGSWVLSAGSAIIGKVGIDQTTDGTTNLVRLGAETTKVIGVAKIGDGTNAVAVKAASTGPAATDPALVVAISPNSVNANLSDGSGQTSAAHTGAPTVNLDPYSQYKTVAASSTAQVLGATGAQYDYLAGVLIIPATSAAGAVSITDGNGSAISIFAGGGTTALADLKPFMVPLGLHCLAGTTPGWKITTGANVTAIGIGKFT